MSDAKPKEEGVPEGDENDGVGGPTSEEQPKAEDPTKEKRNGK